MPRKPREKTEFFFGDYLSIEHMIKQLRAFIHELVKMDCADFMPSSTQGSITVYWKPKELTQAQIDEVLAYWRGDHLPPDPHQEEARRILSGKSTPYRDGTKNLHENIKLIREDEDE